MELTDLMELDSDLPGSVDFFTNFNEDLQVTYATFMFVRYINCQRIKRHHISLLYQFNLLFYEILCFQNVFKGR